MHERACLRRVPDTLASQMLMRHPPQFFVDERDEPIQRRRVTIVPIQKQSRHFPARQFVLVFGKRSFRVFGSMSVHMGEPPCFSVFANDLLRHRTWMDFAAETETTGAVEAGEIFFCEMPQFRPNLRM